MTLKYILDGKRVIPCDDIVTWGRWMQEGNRRIAETKIGDREVSTVFLGIDHNYGEKPNPMLFETMVFRPSTPEERASFNRVLPRTPLRRVQDADAPVERYSTYDEAEAGHNRIVQMLKLTVDK